MFWPSHVWTNMASLSHVPKVFFIPQKSIRWIYVWTKLKCWFVLKHFTPPFLSNSYIEQMKKKCILSHCAIYNPSTLQNKTFSIPRKLTCRVSFQIYPSRPYKENSWTFWNFTNTLTLQINTFNIWIKLTRWLILLDLPALSPTKHYV